MQLLQWQSKGTKNWIKCSINCQLNLDGCGEPSPGQRRNDDDLCSLNYTRNCSHLSTSSIMSENFTPTLVYQRRRRVKNSVSIFTSQLSNGNKSSDGCHSTISSKVPSLAAQELFSVSEHATDASGSPIMHPVECNTMSMASFKGGHARGEAGHEGASTVDMNRILNACSANDNCLSSKSNLELSSVSLKIDRADAGENSSSGALIADKAAGEISERDICISILRSQGLLDKVWTRQDKAYVKSSSARSNHYRSMSCKVCKRMESTINMLICDKCEDAFHIFCYNPPITILPVGEWLCRSCLKRKHRILKDKSSSNSINMSNETGRNRYSTSEGEFGSFEFLFGDTEPYITNVRIGDEFQADVPDWSGPIDEECDPIGDPLEMNSMKEGDFIKPLKLSSIGHWLQCRAVIEGINEGVDGTICAKWRRAPLFEVQTDEWECFRCVLWDPAHADCAVPQELDTEEIMRQLKYIESLRPRLAAKRRKLDCSKSTG